MKETNLQCALSYNHAGKTGTRWIISGCDLLLFPTGSSEPGGFHRRVYNYSGLCNRQIDMFH
jgi:hypothetical protein